MTDNDVFDMSADIFLSMLREQPPTFNFFPSSHSRTEHDDSFHSLGLNHRLKQENKWRSNSARRIFFPSCEHERARTRSYTTVFGQLNHISSAHFYPFHILNVPPLHYNNPSKLRFHFMGTEVDRKFPWPDQWFLFFSSQDWTFNFILPRFRNRAGCIQVSALKYIEPYNYRQ